MSHVWIVEYRVAKSKRWKRTSEIISRPTRKQAVAYMRYFQSRYKDAEYRVVKYVREEPK